MTPVNRKRDALGVVDDGASEGVEFVEITYEYINGCGELITTTSKVVILDPIPVEATPSDVDCQNLDKPKSSVTTTSQGTALPLRLGQQRMEQRMGRCRLDGVFDSLFTMTDDEGALLPSHNIELIVIDQKAFTFEQEVLYPVMTEAEICGGNTQDFPAFNSGILDEDVRFNGVSLITNNLSDVPLIVDATETGERWKLNGIVADVVEDTWQGVLTLVDTCGYETEALVRVRDCVVPNVFTPDASGDNDNFRIRGLDGHMGSRLMIYNRYGTIVFQDETATDADSSSCGTPVRQRKRCPRRHVPVGADSGRRQGKSRTAHLAAPRPTPCRAIAPDFDAWTILRLHKDCPVISSG